MHKGLLASLDIAVDFRRDPPEVIGSGRLNAAAGEEVRDLRLGPTPQLLDGDVVVELPPDLGEDGLPGARPAQHARGSHPRNVT